MELTITLIALGDHRVMKMVGGRGTLGVDGPGAGVGAGLVLRARR